MSYSFPSPLQTKRTELHPDTQKREERRSPLCWDRLSSLFSFKISGIYQNRTAGQLKLLPMKWPPPSFPLFLFLFLFLLLLLFLPCHPFFFLPLPFPLSFLFLSAPTFSSSPSLPPRYQHFTPLFVTPFFCCGSSIDFQHEPAHFSTTKDCDPIYRIPFRRLDTTLRADQSSQRPTLHPS